MANGIGGLAFVGGIILALIFGVISFAMPAMFNSISGIAVLILIILGLVVGFVNIKDEHITDFLIAVIAIALIGMLPVQQLAFLTPDFAKFIGVLLQNIVALAVPAALVLGLKQVWVLGTSK